MMKFSRSSLAHPRSNRAHWPETPASPSNQLTRQGDFRPGCRIERAVRFAPVPSQISWFTRNRPALSLTPWQPSALEALICSLCSGAQELRPLAPGLLTESANQLIFSDQRHHRFLPSLPCPNTRQRRERIGGIRFDHANPLPETPLRGSLIQRLRFTEFSHLCGHFPLSNDRQDSTFRTESADRRKTRFFRFPSACQARFGKRSPLAQNCEQVAFI
jgi:hypothetical protein